LLPLLSCTTFERHVFPVDQQVWSLAVSPDGRVIAINGIKRGDAAPHCLAFWDVATGKLLAANSDHYVSWSMGFTKDGKRVVTYSVVKQDQDERRSICALDVATGQEKQLLKGDAYRQCYALLPDKMIFVLGGANDDIVHVRDFATGDKADLKGHEFRCQQATLSADGRTVATFDGATIRIWDFPSGKERYRLPADFAFFWGEAFCLSPDGKLLAYRTQLPPPLVWDITPGQQKPRQMKLPAFKNRADVQFSYLSRQHLCFSPDGRYLAVKVGVFDNKIKDFSDQHVAETIELVSMPDGKLVATLRALGPPRATDGSLNHLTFSADGRWIAANGRSRIHVWRVP
jgi:WD40 repeat protein